MAKVLLDPIGAAREQLLDGAAWEAQRAHHLEARRALDGQARRGARGLGGEVPGARVREKGKLPTWERIEALRDPDSPVLPIGTLVNYGRTFGEEARTSPGAGVVTAFLRVHGRWVVVIANDNTVASGSWWPRTPEKIQRAQEVALRLRLPVGVPGGLLGPVPSGAGDDLPGPHGSGRHLPPERGAVRRRGCRRSRACTGTASPAAATCRSSATSST